ncbi:MAG: DUF6242 domain-containing protein [Dysgonamonadaceae bacterium]|jgi:hypothetical protein|nr:DUF6242 domain-containing protein [Dysgonamonadaceae bacterium]
MLSKNKLIILLLFPVIACLHSCLGNDEYDETPLTEDAEILSFSLSNDSVPSLKNVVFSIDQRLNLIYNRDSMPYGTEIKRKVIVTYTGAAGGNSVRNITGSDSTWIKSGDSIDVSKPLLLQSFALGGNTTKVYTVKLNIHQTDPDSVQYKQVTSNRDFLQSEAIQSLLFKDKFHIFTQTGDSIKLYTSGDAVDWTETPLLGLPANTVVRGMKSSGEKLFAHTTTGDCYESADAGEWTKIILDYPVASVLGFLKLSEGQAALFKEGLSLIVEKDNQPFFAFLSDAINIGDAVPADFPVSDFAAFNNERSKLGYLTLVGGLSATGDVLNKVWSTGNGLYWAELTNTNTAGVFPPLRGANVLRYNNEYWLLNGILSDNTCNANVYFSGDGGMTWTLKPDKCRVPEDYTKRYGATAVVDGAGVYFYLLGGKSESGVFLPEIWKGYLNKRTFGL